MLKNIYTQFCYFKAKHLDNLDKVTLPHIYFWKYSSLGSLRLRISFLEFLSHKYIQCFFWVPFVHYHDSKQIFWESNKWLDTMNVRG